jgi:hydrogenase-4 component B
MPWTALCFLVGAVSICGLPPLNGFVSEFLIYLGLFRTMGDGVETALPAASLGAPALALIGALAVACFVKVFGAVFLGAARTDEAMHAHDSPMTMVGPMLILVGCCAFIGLAPLWIAPILMLAVEDWAPELSGSGAGLAALAPLSQISAAGCLLVGVLFITSAGLWWRVRCSVERGATWGCGYAAPTTRIQYTSSSFAQLLVGLFSWALRPRVRRPVELPLLPLPTSFSSSVPDVVLDEVILPVFRSVAWIFSRLRVLQQGNVQAYLLYIFLVLFGLLLWR